MIIFKTSLLFLYYYYYFTTNYFFFITICYLFTKHFDGGLFFANNFFVARIAQLKNYLQPFNCIKRRDKFKFFVNVGIEFVMYVSVIIPCQIVRLYLLCFTHSLLSLFDITNVF